jgi:glutamate-1-semialdehyde aminotransferase
MRELTAERIATMDQQAARIRSGLEERAATAGLPLAISAEGSVMGVYASASVPSPTEPLDDGGRTRQLHLAALNNGVLMGPGGEVSMSTVLSEDDANQVIDRIGSAIDEVATNAHA